MKQSAVPNTERLLRLCSRLLPAVLILLTIATASLVVGIFLQFDVWTNEEIIHGPFPTEQLASRTAVVPVGQVYTRIPCRIGVQSDRDKHGTASGLRAWLNGRELGPPHTLHAEIRAGKTAGFSHWDNYIRFYIPDPMPNDQSISLRVQYPIQYSDEFLGANEVIVAILFLLACVGGRMASNIAQFLLGTIRIGLVTSAVALPIYIIFLVLGYLTQQPVAATYVFQYLPIDGALNIIEPYFPRALIILAIVLTTLNWRSGLDIALVHATRHAELRTLKLWRQIGLFSTAAVLYLFVSAGAWSGHVLWHDLPSYSIGGLVPYSDAAGYFGGGLNYLIFDQIDPWNLRRPLAALFRSDTVFVGGFNYVGTLLVQIAAISLSIYVATMAIIKWRGVAAGFAFWAMAFILFRPFATTTMTEPLALLWAFFAIPVFIHGLQHQSFRHLLLAMTFLFVALFVRMGAMFVMPFLVLWTLFYVGANVRLRIRNASCVFGVLLVVLLVNVLLDKVYGGSDAQLGSNFSSALCGMSVGGDMHACMSRYASELQRLPEAAMSDFFYLMAANNIVHDPGTFVLSMGRDVARFFGDIFSMPTTWYHWYSDPEVESAGLYLVSFIGWIYALQRSANRVVGAFAFFVGLGILTSVPFVYIDDARRVLYATNPLIALLIAGGFYAPGALRLRSATLEWRRGAILLPATIVLTLLLPFALRLAGIGKPSREVPADLRNDQQIIAGHAMQTGFVVLPDTAPKLPDVPSMTISKFREFLTSSQAIPLVVIQNLPEPPFAFVHSVEWARLWWYNAYFLPPEVFRDKSVDRWRVTVAPIDSMPWAIGRDAVPAK